MQMAGIPFSTTDWSKVEQTEYKGEAEYEICQVDLFDCRSLRPTSLDSTVFFGIEKRHKLSAGHKSS